MKIKIITIFCFVFFLAAFSFSTTNTANAGSATISHEMLYDYHYFISGAGNCFICGNDPIVGVCDYGSNGGSCSSLSELASYTHDYPLGSVKKVTKVNVWGQARKNEGGGFDLGIKLLKNGSVVATKTSLEYARSAPFPGWSFTSADPSITALDFGGIDADTIRVFITTYNEGGYWSDVWYEYLPSAVNLTSGSCLSPGSTATLRWNASSGATSYVLRIDDTTTGTNDDPCGAGSAGDSCPTVNGTSYSFASTPGHSYRFWAHACDSTGCNWAASTPGTISFTCAAAAVNGACGTANRTYASTDTSWGAYTFCASGTVSPASPTFPAAGSSTSWTCVGSGGGTTASCSGSRSSAAGSNTLSLTKTPAAGGTVTSSPSGISCGTSCSSTSASYSSGTSVNLTASAASGYNFTGWGGACAGTATTCNVTMSANRSVTATFTLKAAVCGNGAREGSETCDLGSSNGACPATCSATCTTNSCACVPNNCASTTCTTSTCYNNCAWVTGTKNCVSAGCGNGAFEPALGEDCDNGVANNGSCPLLCSSICRNNTCGGSPQSSLRIDLRGSGSGSVKANYNDPIYGPDSFVENFNIPAICTSQGLSCPTISTSPGTNSTFVITPSANAGSVFTGFSDPTAFMSGYSTTGCLGTSPCSFALNRNKEVVANFCVPNPQCIAITPDCTGHCGENLSNQMCVDSNGCGGSVTCSPVCSSSTTACPACSDDNTWKEVAP